MNWTRKTLAAVTLAIAGAASAAGPSGSTAGSDAAKTQYEAERMRCLSGTTGQDQASCLKSAGAAYDAIRQDRLNDANTGYRENALARCKNLPSADRADCEARIDGTGTGTTSGSVKNGGIIRETVTTTPAPGTTEPPPTTK